MTARRKLTLEDFFGRISSEFKYRHPAWRLRISGDDGLLIWRRRGLKAGVVVSPSLKGAFVFLGHARVQVEAVTECVAILRAIFAGEIIEVQATGSGGDIWMAHASAPGVHINRYDKGKSVEVPVFTKMEFRSWPPD